MERKVAIPLYLFAFWSFLGACITAPILYGKSRGQSTRSPTDATTTVYHSSRFPPRPETTSTLALTVTVSTTLKSSSFYSTTKTVSITTKTISSSPTTKTSSSGSISSSVASTSLPPSSIQSTTTSSASTTTTTRKSTASFATSSASTSRTTTTAGKTTTKTPITTTTTATTTTTTMTSTTTEASTIAITDTTSITTKTKTTSTTMTTTTTTTIIATTTATTTTTIDPTINQCYGYDCGGGVCFEIDDVPTCIHATIGFLTHDKKMTVKCGDGAKNQKWMKTKNLNSDGIHHVDFEATPRKNEYIIHTHTLYADKQPTQAVYFRKSGDNNYQYVNHVRTRDIDASKHGNTWLIERIACDDEECPYTVRAAGDQTRGWKNNIDGSYNWLRMDKIDLKNRDFLWWIELQEY